MLEWNLVKELCVGVTLTFRQHVGQFVLMRGDRASQVSPMHEHRSKHCMFWAVHADVGQFVRMRGDRALRVPLVRAPASKAHAQPKGKTRLCENIVVEQANQKQGRGGRGEADQEGGTQAIGEALPGWGLRCFEREGRDRCALQLDGCPVADRDRLRRSP